MRPVYYFLIFFAAALGVILVSRLRLSVTAAYAGGSVRIRLDISFLFGLVKLKRRFLLRLTGGKIGFFIVKKSGLEPLKRHKSEKQKHRPSFIRAGLESGHIRSLFVTGKVGIDEDAAATCFISGVISIVLNTAFELISMLLLRGKKAEKKRILISPDFEGSGVSLGLEGIIEASAGKLITKSIGVLLKQKS